jgi:leucyl-tRNA synthetase
MLAIQDTNVVAARWPEVGVVNHTLIREAEYFNEVVHEFRLRIKKMMDMRGKVCHSSKVSGRQNDQ